MQSNALLLSLHNYMVTHKVIRPKKQSGTTIYLYKIVYFETHNYFLMVEIGQACTNYD